MPYVNRSASSLISAFVISSRDSIAHKSKSSRLLLDSVAEQAGLSLTWSLTPEDRFSCDVAHYGLSHISRSKEIPLINYAKQLSLKNNKNQLVFVYFRKGSLIFIH